MPTKSDIEILQPSLINLRDELRHCYHGDLVGGYRFDEKEAAAVWERFKSVRPELAPLVDFQFECQRMTADLEKQVRENQHHPKHEPAGRARR